jgi:hypothetical protein
MRRAGARMEEREGTGRRGREGMDECGEKELEGTNKNRWVRMNENEKQQNEQMRRDEKRRTGAEGTNKCGRDERVWKGRTRTHG